MTSLLANLLTRLLARLLHMAKIQSVKIGKEERI